MLHRRVLSLKVPGVSSEVECSQASAEQSDFTNTCALGNEAEDSYGRHE